MTFHRVALKSIPSIQSQWSEWHDEKTGLRHIHIQRDDVEMACLIAVPTHPANDRGAPHILEHLSLCANRRFPVRDAFFGMRQRSMASFMNAMTDSDITYYPFATPNEKDFFHLLEVYANAVFFPRLERLDFLQEGWRYTLDDEGRLGIEGVVFNEMKGALAGADRLYQHRITQALHPGTRRANLAGGDPLAIPDLTHEELKAFHAEHYHPGRAIIVTYGTVDPAKVQERLATWVLGDPWTALEPFPAEASRLAAPAHVEIPIGTQQATESEHRVTRAWILGDGASPVARLEAAVMGHLLFGEGAPLSSAIEGAGMGRAGAMGIDTGGVHIEAQVGMDGLGEDEVAKAAGLIDDSIRRVAREGVPVEQIRAAFRQVEMAQREISGGGGMPFGVALSLETASAVLRGRDPFQAIDRTAALDALRERLQGPQDVARWVRCNLQDNPRRVDAHGRPDPLFFERRQAALDERLASATRSLTDEGRAGIRADMEALAQRQAKVQHEQCLPAIRPQDVPVLPPPLPTVEWGRDSHPRQAILRTPSNGLIRLGVTLDVGHLPIEDLIWVDAATWLLFQVGIEGMDWEQAGQWRNEKAGGMDAGVMLIQPVDRERGVVVHANLDAITLEPKSLDAVEALARTLGEGRMDEAGRITHLLSSRTDALVQRISIMGDALARVLAMAHTHPGNALVHALNGPEAVRQQAERRQRLALGDAGDVLASLQRALGHMRQAHRIIRGEGENPDAAARSLATRVGAGGAETGGEARVGCPEPAQVALTADTAVSYCWQAFRGPGHGHPDAAPAAILARLLSHEVLHTSIRERGGAYGGGLRHQPGAMAFFSYRDPRVAGTFMDFQRAIDAGTGGNLPGRKLDEAILGVLRDADPPGTPHARAQRAWVRGCQGWTQSDQASYREQVRGTTAAEVARVAREWLGGTPSSRVVFTHPRNREEAERCGLAVEPLLPEARPRADASPGRSRNAP